MSYLQRLKNYLKIIKVLMKNANNALPLELKTIILAF